MLTRPDQISDPELLRCVRDGWSTDLLSVDYHPVGFGSHHWLARGSDGRRWFVTVDDLIGKVSSDGESMDAAYDRLHAALVTARAARECGAEFVVAPIPRAGGEVLLRFRQRFAVALYAHVDGRAGRFSDVLSVADRRAVADLLAALHDLPERARRAARVDDLRIASRDSLDTALADLGRVWDTGPYAEPTRRLLGQHSAALDRLLATYDRRAHTTGEHADASVLTHGEPHPGNLIRTDDGWVLVDWDTALLAPPERDLWMLDPGDRSVADAYTEATGRPVHADVMDLYRLRWDLTDVALFVSGFRRAHDGSGDDESSLTYLGETLDRLSART
ncbi:MAG: phosphotransferase [Actinomycetes bacterium]